MWRHGFAWFSRRVVDDDDAPHVHGTPVGELDVSQVPAGTFVGSLKASTVPDLRWLEDARALGSQHLVTVLVGNKSDREEEREVEWAEASRWAAEHGEVT